MSTEKENKVNEELERAESNLIKYLETLKYGTAKASLQLSTSLVVDAKQYSDASEKRLETFVRKCACSKWYNRWFYLLRYKQVAKKFFECFGRLCYLERDIVKNKTIIGEYEKKYQNACEQENK